MTCSNPIHPSLGSFQILKFQYFFLLLLLFLRSYHFQLTAVLADCAGRLRGRIAGLVGVFNCLGGVFSAFVLLRLPTWLSKRVNNKQSIQYSFFVPGTLAVLFAFLYFFLCKPRPHTPSTCTSSIDPLTPSSVSKKKNYFRSLWQDFKKGFTLAKDWRMIVTYASGLVARANSVVITNFIPLWVTAYAVDSKTCSLEDYRLKLEVKSKCEEVYFHFSSLTGMVYVVLLIGSPFWGYLSDRFGITETLLSRSSKYQSPTFPIFLSCLVGAFGYALLSMLEAPMGWKVYAICVVIGFGSIGTIVTSATMMSASYIDPKFRGSVSGVYSFFGALGIVLCSSLGGFLFDFWYPAPFALVGVLHVIVALLCILAMFYGPPLPPYLPSASNDTRFSVFRKKKGETDLKVEQP